MKNATRAIKFSRKALALLVKFCQRNPWAYAAIADEMTKASRETFYRQEVNAWLHPVQEKRTEPRLGAGLLLMAIGEKVSKQATQARK